MHLKLFYNFKFLFFFIKNNNWPCQTVVNIKNLNKKYKGKRLDLLPWRNSTKTKLLVKIRNSRLCSSECRLLSMKIWLTGMPCRQEFNNWKDNLETKVDIQNLLRYANFSLDYIQTSLIKKNIFSVPIIR